MLTKTLKSPNILFTDLLISQMFISGVRRDLEVALSHW